MVSDIPHRIIFGTEVIKPQGVYKTISYSYSGRLMKYLWSNAQPFGWRLGIKPGTIINYSLLPLMSFPDFSSVNIPIFDIVTLTLIFIFIILIFFLVDKQLRNSKAQSLASIDLLEKERDELERRISHRTLELIAARKARTEELERVAKFGELSQGLFHDLINPLSAASLSIEQLALQKTSLQETEVIINKAVEASRRMSSYLDSIKAVMGNPKDHENTAETTACLSVILDLLAYKIREAKVKIKTSYSRSYKLYIHPLRLQQLFLNLISNAIESCSENKFNEERIVSIHMTSHKNNLLININDTGIGIPENIISQIFHKSFTTKKEGLGIGLMTVKSIVEDQLRGTISIKNAPRRGALCEITIPLK